MLLTMKKSLTLTFVALLTCLGAAQLYAQTIVGTWKTIDDKTKLATSHIEIYQEGDAYFGKVVRMLRDDPSSLCTKCTGDKKDQPIMDMVILRNMKKVKKGYSEGFILDPESGKEYDCNIYLESNDKLILRGYIGAPLFGRSQDWFRVD